MHPIKKSIFDKLGDNATEADLLRLRCDSQSLSFYSDISNYLSKHIVDFGVFSLLDVGPRTGAGLAFLRLAHHPNSFTSLKFDPVFGIDLDPTFREIAENEFLDIRPKTEDLFNLESKSFDIVICSHTIEHILDPKPFIEQLERVAKKIVVLAAPYYERYPMSQGHVCKIDCEFLDKLGYMERLIYTSHHFHNGLCFIAMKNLY